MLISSALLLAGGAVAVGWWARWRDAESPALRASDPGSTGPTGPTAQGADDEPAPAADPSETVPADVDAALRDESLFRLSMGASVTALALSTAGLMVLSIPAFVVALVPFAKRLYAGAREGSHRGVAFIEFASITGTLALGYVYVGQISTALVLGSQWLLKMTEGRSRHRLLDVYGSLPDTVLVEREGSVVEVELDDVEVGEVVQLEAGRIVPVDGIVLTGRVQIDERALTGESRPVERGEGEPVYASTLVVQGRARARVERSGRDSVAAEIVEVLNRTADYSTEIRSRGQQIVEQGAAPTLALSGLALVTMGPVPAVAVLFAAFGYNMRYAAPIAVLTFFERTSRRGILVKDGRALERLAEVDVVVFDKTGTLTADVLVLEGLHPVPPVDEDALLTLAAACELHQSHPVAQAIVAAAERRGLELLEPSEVGVEVGLGVRAIVGGETVAVGGERLMRQAGVLLPDWLCALQSDCDVRGGSLVFVARARALVGAIELSVRLRPEAAGVVDLLRRRGQDVCILSGDRRGPTQHLAEELGIDRYFAEVLPQDKARIVAELQTQGKTVCFVGDGINDAIALRKADVSVSLAGASALATDTAPIVLMSGDLERLPEAFALADELSGNLRTSTVLSVAPGVICIAGVFVGAIGLTGAMVWSNASLLASLGNSLRPLLQLLAEAAGEGPPQPPA